MNTDLVAAQISDLARACNPADLPAFAQAERFAGDAALDLPLLDPDHQAPAVITPVVPWGSMRRSARMEGTWHFYTDDYRFSGLWKAPGKLLQTGCIAAVEPNFSTYNDMPAAEAIYRTYQKRWIARYWQVYGGIKILVDLNVSIRFAKLNLLGVPPTWRAFATRGYSDRILDLEAEHELACEHAGTREIVFMVVGGGRLVHERCEAQRWIHIQEYREGVKHVQALR